jgi:hypothetical protein
MNYKLLPDDALYGKPATCITIKGTGIFIPKDLSNTDYQEYLEWVAAGNTPEAAD